MSSYSEDFFCGKRILFFAPQFFGYDHAVASTLRALGAQVDTFDERPNNSFWTKVSIRMRWANVNNRIHQYYNSILEKIQEVPYDYVFFLNPESVKPAILARYREQLPRAIFILYVWDSVKNKKEIPSIATYFHRRFTFDPSDAVSLPDFQFRSLFYIDQYAETRNQELKYDLSFIGTIHSDRYTIGQTILSQCNNWDLKTFFYYFMPNPLLFWLKKMVDWSSFKQAKLKEINFSGLTQDETMEIIKQSKAILDIEHPGQQGLTMRVLEALGADKKIVTTNSKVLDYDFYHPSNVLLIDRDYPTIDKQFFDLPYVAIAPAIKSRYSLKGWLKELFF